MLPPSSVYALSELFSMGPFYFYESHVFGFLCVCVGAGTVYFDNNHKFFIGFKT